MKKHRLISLILGFLTLIGLFALSRCSISFDYVKITSPYDGEFTYDPNVNVQGYASLDLDYYDDFLVELYINDVFDNSQQSPSFSFYTILDDGYNRITVDVFKNGRYQFSDTIGVYLDS